MEDPASDMETETSTKRSQSKPEHARSPRRQAKQAKKAMVHKKILSKEEADSLTVEEVMDMTEQHRKRNSTLSEVLLHQFEENQKEDLLAKLFTEHLETSEMKVPEITEEQVQEPNKVLLATCEVCPFCKKVLDEKHVLEPRNLHERAPAVHLHAGGLLRVRRLLGWLLATWVGNGWALAALAPGAGYLGWLLGCPCRAWFAGYLGWLLGWLLGPPSTGIYGAALLSHPPPSYMVIVSPPPSVLLWWWWCCCCCWWW